MNQQWYEPIEFSEWVKRAFSLFNIGIVIFTAVFMFSEFRFDWCEKYIGSYLASTNDGRPEKGAIWKAGKQTSDAHRFLKEIVTQQQNAKRNVMEADTFAQLSSRILPGEWVQLEKDHFKKLYLSLPESFAGKMMTSIRLFWLLSSQSVDRIFCEGVMEGLKIYFLDAENRVLEMISLEKQEILEIENSKKPLEGRLETIKGFEGRIYPADVFFNALFALSANIGSDDLIVNPEVLLKEEGKVTKVGIWNEANLGYIRLGFEFEYLNTRKVVFVKGREWAIWQLSINLKGDEN
ncbi:MAG: hypothetical protein GY729_11205 [Desulfobacteraceae bacterium]|nr:hypothetical protein [Desulfobacteraceae bacterium]